MKKKIILVFVIAMLMLVSVFAGAIKINDNEKPLIIKTLVDNDAELPIWVVGDTWSYTDVEFEGGYAENLSFDLSIDDFTLKVAQVQNDKYKLDISVPLGSVTGNVQVDVVLGMIPIHQQGELINTKMDGTLYINKSDLGIIESTLNIDGYIDKPVIDWHFNADVDIDFFKDVGGEWLPVVFPHLKFPMNVWDRWSINTTYITAQIGTFLIPEGIELMMLASPHDVECISKGNVNVPAGTFEALKIESGSNDYYWYAPSAGNIVKVEYSNIDMGWDWSITKLEMKLVSTNYEPPNQAPDAPDKPTGEIDGRAGVPYEYCTSGGDDPENNQVQYGFDWDGDNNVDDDDWTDLVDSGEEACITHAFSSGGDYNIKAKTRDEKGAESSDWSTVLTVHMAPNNPPNQPDTPSGTTGGEVGIAYEYTSDTVSDPDGDTVTYIFKWGDGDTSDELNTPTASHTWIKKGTYQVTVVAKDIFGAQSESNPLAVTINNQAPVKPITPDGPTTGKKGDSLKYTTSTTDPDGHKVKYGFDWDGDNNVDDWTGFVNSGDSVSASHVWDSKGIFQIRVKAVDYYGEESEFSDPFGVEIPRYRSFSSIFIDFLNILKQRLSVFGNI